jgi:hypothetical protein
MPYLFSKLVEEVPKMSNGWLLVSHVRGRGPVKHVLQDHGMSPIVLTEVGRLRIVESFNIEV